jgi:hypothetical protein
LMDAVEIHSPPLDLGIRSQAHRHDLLVELQVY